MRFNRRTILAFAALPFVAYLLSFILPFFSTARMSLNEFTRSGGLQRTVSWSNFKELFTDEYFVETWLTTFSIALRVAIVTTVLAGLAAYYMWQRGGKVRARFTVIFLLPLFVSGVVRAYGWIPMTGPNSLFQDITGLSLLFDQTAVIVAMVHIMMPYAVISLLGAFDGVEESAIKASHNLGASSFGTAMRVLIPSARQGITSAFLLVFAITSSAYAIPSIVGGRKVNVISIAIYQEQMATRNQPLAAALTIALVAITLLIMTVSSRFGGGKAKHARAVVT